jgi:Ca2+-binding EF-hand superfamily protein
MNTKKTTLIAAIGLALAALPSAFAGDAATKLKQMDPDGDGRITRTEHAAGVQAKFGKLDTNSDGIISAAELAADREQRTTSKLKFWEKDNKTPVSEKLSSLDQNGDGQVTRAEYETHADASFTALDADKDGTISEKELDAGHKDMKDHR